MQLMDKQYLIYGEEQQNNEGGFCLVELLVSVIIIAIITMGVAGSTIAAMKYAKFTEANHIASSLAISKMEELASRTASELDSSDSETEDAVTWPGTDFTFKRVTTVAVNADNSRRVEIVVSTNNAPIPTSAKFGTTFAVWE